MVIPGSGVIRMRPVSVYHHVSTTGAVPPPTWVRYNSQASGLIGSPTLPKIRIEDRRRPPGNDLSRRLVDRAVVRMGPGRPDPVRM